MNLLSRFLLPLAACAAFLAAPGHAQARDQDRRQFDLPKIDWSSFDWSKYGLGDLDLRNIDWSKLDLRSIDLRDPKWKDKLKQLLAKYREGQGGGSSGGSAPPAGTPPKVLALYDAPSGTPWDKLGFAYAIMLRNLLGHFDAQVELLPVQQYAAGQMEGFHATFYLGAAYDHQLPAAFLADAAATSKTMVWFKYNLWQLAWDPAYDFQASKGITLQGLRGMNEAPSSGNPNPGFFDTVQYKGLDFVKYYTYDAGRNVINADPDIGLVAVGDAAKASTVVPVANPKTGETAPYIVRSGNFWYVADLPFSFIGPRDRYLVFTDLLHDMLGIQHAESHRAMVRLEDVSALVSVQAMKSLTDYLAGKRVPFSIAVIPRYVDALGAYNGGEPQEISLAQATNLRTSLDYARQRGNAEIVMHGFTHQYGKMRNPHTGVSGDDYEFWNIVDNQPVPEDSTAWVQGRLGTGLYDLRSYGYQPVAWEAPHYHTSAIAARTAAGIFATTYQRVVYYTADKPDFTRATGKDFSVGQFYPYIIGRDHYGQRVLPENLGNIEYDISTIDPTSNYNYTAEDLVTNAKYARAVRDGFASFFFHPFWLEPTLGTPGFEDFRKTVEGITQLGFSWVAPSSLR